MIINNSNQFQKNTVIKKYLEKETQLFFFVIQCSIVSHTARNSQIDVDRDYRAALWVITAHLNNDAGCPDSIIGE